MSEPTDDGGKKRGVFYGLIHSNLFVALLLWALTAIGWGISFYARTVQIEQWKAETSTTLKRMDEFGTIHGHYADERQDLAIIDLQARMKKSEEEGRQWEVIKSEHHHLVEDVYDLKHEPKK